MDGFRSKLGIAVLILYAGLLTGCLVTSIRPLHDAAHPPVFDNALLGRWIASQRDKGSQDNAATVQLLVEPFRKGNDTSAPSYRITHTTEFDNQVRNATVLVGSLVDLGSMRILDTEFGSDPIHEANLSNAARLHRLPVHFFTKVDVTDNTLVLSSLNNSWFTKTALEEQVSIPCLFRCNGSAAYCDVVLTGTPRQLREFLRKYGDQQGLFDGNGSTAWRRAPPGLGEEPAGKDGAEKDGKR